MPEEAAGNVKVKRATHPGRAGRKRRAAGWTLFTLGVLVAGVWAWSGYDSLGGSLGPCYTWVYRGNAQLTFGAAEERRRLHKWNVQRIIVFTPPPSLPASERWSWVCGKTAEFPFSLLIICVPIWPIPLILWTPAALLLRSGILARRRANTGACPKCGYSLAGLGDGAMCPECWGGAGTK